VGIVNFPLENCPYCGTQLETVEWPNYYRCRSCDDWVFHDAVLGGGTVVLDRDSLILVEDFRDPGEWTLTEKRPEIPESLREGVAPELEEETELTLDPGDLVSLYDNAAEPLEDRFMMGIYYAVERSKTTGRSRQDPTRSTPGSGGPRSSRRRTRC
jgi:ADP-ribose pyrophosphatase YjhB (NUDIX family)